MVVAFAAWGSLVVDYSLERLGAICLLYFLALGISAHCLDALGSKTKPWGFLSKKKLWIISLITLSVVAGISSYILIKTSCIYKNLKKQSAEISLIYRKEIVLKLISSGVILSTILFFLIRHL